MARRTRLWVCRCCRRAWHRRKADHPHGCAECPGITLTAARTFPSPRTRPCKHASIEAALAAWRERRWSRPRTAGGLALRRTRDLGRLWKRVCEARTFPARVRRYQAWLDALAVVVDDNLGPDGEVARWTESLGPRGERRRHAARHAAPNVRVAPLAGAFGMFERKGFASDLPEIPGRPTSRYLITVDERARARPVSAQLETLLHEALHYLDEVAGVEGGRHDRLWERRLAAMRSLFPPGAR